jgi:carbamoyl-phosphate synthase large subunit
VPFVSKAIGVPLAKLAALVMAGETLKSLGFTKEIRPRHSSVKEAVFPFIRFPGIDVLLSPEMKSTGEVMGIDGTTGMAFLKSQIAAGNTLPTAGNVFLSVRDADKPSVVPLAKQLTELGFSIYATVGTSTVLRNHGIRSQAIFAIAQGRPNVVDLIEEKNVAWIVNTPSPGVTPRVDEVKMRAHAVVRGIPITTTIDGLRAAVAGLEALRKMDGIEVCSLQEFHRHSPKLKLKRAAKHPSPGPANAGPPSPARGEATAFASSQPASAHPLAQSHTSPSPLDGEGRGEGFLKEHNRV